MRDSLAWWGAVQLMALVAAPMCLALFAPLADRGWGLSKAFGLLVFSYAVWVLGVTRLLPNGALAYGAAIVIALGGSALVVRRSGLRPLVTFVQRRWGLLLIQEAVLLAAYVGFLLIRRHNPDISGTEKFMDFAFMNAIAISRSFPPFDPWLAPGPAIAEPTINYYYFGYLMQGLLTRFTGVQPAVGFNLALGMLFGLAAVGAFSLCYGLARDLVAERAMSRGVSAREQLGRWSFRAARPYLTVGALGAYLLLLSGNLWTFLRRYDGSGIWEKDFWQGVGWNATRVLVIRQGDRDIDYTINEFPAFSFLLGDLHPHVLALPFVLLAVGLAYAWLMRPPLLYAWALAGEALTDRRGRWGRLAPYLELAPGALILGSLYFLNSWDFPAYFALAQAAALAGAWWRRDEEGGASWMKAVGVVALSGALAVALFLPFHLTFNPPVLADAESRLPLGLVLQRSFLNQFLQFWGIQLLLLAPVLVAALAAMAARRWWLVALSALALVGLADRLGSGALMLSLVVAMGSGSAALRALAPADDEQAGDQIAARRPLAFALGLVCLAALLMATCEVVHIRDFYGGALRRMNTVFKFYYQAWLLLAVGGAVAAFWLYRALRARRALLDMRYARYARWGFWVLGTLLLFAGLHFPVRVTWLRTDGFKTPPTLDGMAWMQRFHADDHAAAEWLRMNGATAAQPAQPAPVVLEATGGAYSEFSRMATQTGLPTILGWDQHERLWRGATINDEVERRKADVDAAYSAASFDQAKPILDKYAVSYVVVGYLEEQKYGAGGGLAKFERAPELERVFGRGRTAIYRVRH